MARVMQNESIEDVYEQCRERYFKGEELLARGVEMEAYSVEDEGKGICFHVFVYNVQPGIGLDYATGESWVEDWETVG